MDFWWWIEPLYGTGVVFILDAFKVSEKIVYAILFISIIPIVVSIAAMGAWLFCAFIYAIWSPYI